MELSRKERKKKDKRDGFEDTERESKKRKKSRRVSGRMFVDDVADVGSDEEVCFRFRFSHAFQTSVAG